MMVDMDAVERNSKNYVEYLARSKNEYYTVHPVTAIEKNGAKSSLLVGSPGFEIRNRTGSAVAAVSLVDNGKVYLSATNQGERFLKANACAALLLHLSIE